MHNTDLLHLFENFLQGGMVSMAYNKMLVTHESTLADLKVPFDKTHCGTDRSLMTMLRGLANHVNMDTEVHAPEGISLFAHRIVLIAFSPEFNRLKDMPHVVMMNHPLKMLMSLWDFMYCSRDSYDLKWRQNTVPSLLASGLLRS